MTQPLKMEYVVDGDNFSHAGEASAAVKKTLRKLGVNPVTIRRVAIALYEGEINMVIHAEGGTIEVLVYGDRITMTLADKGKGIADIPLAMKAGYSTASDEVKPLALERAWVCPICRKTQIPWRSPPPSVLAPLWR